MLVGASSNHILVLHLDALGSIDFEPVVVMDAHTGIALGRHPAGKTACFNAH